MASSFTFLPTRARRGNPCIFYASRPGATAKLWLRPEVSIANSKGYSSREQVMLIAQVLQHREQLEQLGMSSSATAVRFDEVTMWVDLDDGRTLGVPLAWFPVLLRATPAQRENLWLSPGGLHWDEIDEDISVQGLLDGIGDQTNRGERATATAAE